MQHKRKRESTDDEQLVYERAKQRHELECFKLRSPIGTFAIISADNPVPTIMSRVSIRKHYSDDDNFIQQWLHDEHMRVVSRIVVDPSGTSAGNVFNLWKPFRASQLAAVDDHLVPELVEPIVSYIHQHIADGSNGLADWVLNYMARILQYPESKSGMAIWLHGDERCGKSLLFDFFCDQVLIRSCCLTFCTQSSENNAEQVLGPYSSMQFAQQELTESNAIHRVCLQVHGVKRLNTKIHDLIMRNSLFIGCKYVRVANLVNLVITSNSPPPQEDIHIAGFKCSVPADLDGLRAHLQRPEVGRAFFQHLIARPLPAGAGFRKFMRHSHPRLAACKQPVHTFQTKRKHLS